jgi:hypothetical protein
VGSSCAANVVLYFLVYLGYAPSVGNFIVYFGCMPYVGNFAVYALGSLWNSISLLINVFVMCINMLMSVVLCFL